MKSRARLCLYKAIRWIERSLEMLKLTGRAIMYAIVGLVDGDTGASHKRYSITLEAIARRAGCSTRAVTNWLPRLEAMGILEVTRNAPHRTEGGTFVAAPNAYRVLLPPECWTEVRRPDETSAAREPDRMHDRPRERVASPAALVLSVRGKMRQTVEREQGPDKRTSTFDFVTPEELGAALLQEACIAAEACPEERRYVATVGLDGLRRRRFEVANLMARGELTVAQGKLLVRQWVKRTLENAAQSVESADHAVNILIRFVQEKLRLFQRDQNGMSPSLS